MPPFFSLRTSAATAPAPAHHSSAVRKAPILSLSNLYPPPSA